MCIGGLKAPFFIPFIIDREEGDNTFGSAHLSIRVFARNLLFEPMKQKVNTCIHMNGVQAHRLL